MLDAVYPIAVLHLSSVFCLCPIQFRIDLANFNMAETYNQNKLTFYLRREERYAIHFMNGVVDSNKIPPVPFG